MGGSTGNIRTLRNQSSSNGSRTLGSILASDGSSGGAGSIRRMFGYYSRRGNTSDFYERIMNLRYGEFRNRTQWFLKAVF